MKWIRWIAGLVAIAGLTIAAPEFSAAKDWTKIRVGTEGTYPKFSFTDSAGNLQGWDIDIVRAVCEQMAAECEFVVIPFDAQIPALLQGKIDMIASINITEERKKTIGFSNKHYNIPNRFVAKKESGLSISKESLTGKVIGLQTGTIQENYVRDNFGDVITIKLYRSQDEANLDLVSGRIDLTIGQAVVLQDGFLGEPEGAGFEFVGPDITDRRWFGDGTAFGLRKEDTDLRDKLNEALAAVRADHTYQEINAKYFPFDIYGE